MIYVLEHIFTCLLIAGVIGGLVGWFVHRLLSGSKLTELENSWSSKFRVLQDERVALGRTLKNTEATALDWKTKFAGLDGDYGTMKTNFAGVSGKIPIFEAAIAGWTAKAAGWDGERAKMAADLKECAEARGLLETELVGWSQKAKEWDHERARMTAEAGVTASKVALLEGEIGKLKADLAANAKLAADRVAQFEAAALALKKQAADADVAAKSKVGNLEADNAKLKAELGASVKLGIDRAAQAEGELAAAKKLVADAGPSGKAKLVALEMENAKLKAERAAHIKAVSDRIVHLEATHAAAQAVEKAKLAALQHDHEHVKTYYTAFTNSAGDRAATLHTALAAAEAAAAAKLVALEAENAKLKAAEHSRTAQTEVSAGPLRLEISALEKRLAEAQTAHSTEVFGLRGRITELEARAVESKALAATVGATSVVPSAPVVSSPQPEGYGDIERIEGIGPAHGNQLRSIGIAWVATLLERGASARGRAEIVEQTGLSKENVLNWVNSADLLRVDGMTPDWAELLEASGVDTVKELRNRVPQNVQKKMAETNPTNPQGSYARTVPDLETVRGWIEQAKKLDPKLTY